MSARYHTFCMQSVLAYSIACILSGMKTHSQTWCLDKCMIGPDLTAKSGDMRGSLAKVPTFDQSHMFRCAE